ncbi:MAG TPA: FN3 associated domain-containing protein, partial [Bacteroidota bacterium]|nr:FN3 associated domain-containing protein [Bacteroidota bacterium]
LGCVVKDAKIFYTLDGNDPDRNSLSYSSPIWLRQSSIMKAIAIREGKKSKIVSSEFIKKASIGKIILNSKYSQQYTGGGDDALIDGLRGGSDFRLGAWQGYEHNNLDAIIDLGSQKVIDRVALGCLQDNNSWIFFPIQVEFSLSNDGKNFSSSINIDNPVSPQESGAILREFEVSSSPRSARFIRVVAKNIGVCPPWHRGAGGKAWLFVDEIIISTK